MSSIQYKKTTTTPKPLESRRPGRVEVEKGRSDSSTKEASLPLDQKQDRLGAGGPAFWAGRRQARQGGMEGRLQSPDSTRTPLCFVNSTREGDRRGEAQLSERRGAARPKTTLHQPLAEKARGASLHSLRGSRTAHSWKSEGPYYLPYPSLRSGGP